MSNTTLTPEVIKDKLERLIDNSICLNENTYDRDVIDSIYALFKKYANQRYEEGKADATPKEQTHIRNAVFCGYEFAQKEKLAANLDKYKNDMNFNIQFFNGDWNAFVERQDEYGSEVFSIGGYKLFEEMETELFSQLERRFPKL